MSLGCTMVQGTTVPIDVERVDEKHPDHSSSAVAKKAEEHSLILRHITNARNFTPTVLFDAVSELFKNTTNAFQLGNGVVVVAFASEASRDDAISLYQDSADSDEKAAERKKPLTEVFGD